MKTLLLSQFLKKHCSLSLLLISSLFSNIVSADEIRIALRAHKGLEQGMQQWQATADYLSERIPEHRFTMVPFDNISALNQAISRKEFDFCLTNPSSYIKHKIDYGAQPLATLVNKRQGKGYSKFGAVIFTRSDRADITKLSDLMDKSFIAVDELAFGGWRVAWEELLKNKINPFVDFKSVSFAGGIQQDVVFAVRDGNADAGAVRTDMLERLAASGKINLGDFKVIGNKKTEDFPFLHSTSLYPEWVFSATRTVDDNLKTKVVAALFSIPGDSVAAIRGKYVGWISPLDYSSVETLLKKLHVGPFDVTTMSPFERLKSQYGMALLFVILAFILLTLLVLYMLSLNRRISKAQQSLKKEILAREALERQLMHIQKMESLGQLTGGIAHDFNNMLASILGYTELSINSETVRNDKQITQYLQQVLVTGDKAKMLVSQMMAFSRTEGDIEKTEILLVSKLIEEAKKLLRPLLPSNIEFDTNNIGDNLYIKINHVMLDQVLMNLCLNAKDAMTGRTGSGSISISSKLVNYELTQCNSCHQNISGPYVVLEIKDNGSGMDSITKKRLFEPFFSTKDVGKGTGMGLSMVHGIIHEHGGHILLDTEINKGTTVSILLPEASGIHKAPQVKEIKTATKIPPVIAHQHIMVVDDEVSITTYLSELLQQQGYKISIFNNSQKAIDFFAEHHDDINLVITDQTMPDLTGIEMSARMLNISKNIPIIICTGFSEHIDEATTLNLNIGAYLEKPIHSDKLLNTISSLIAEQS